MIDQERLAAVRRAGLSPGSHVDPLDGMCALEAVAWITHSPWNDAPACVSPVVAGMVRHWNDRLDKCDRDRLLVPLVPIIVGTKRHITTERRRSLEAVDWRIRTNLPIWLNLAGWSHRSTAVAALPHASLMRWEEWFQVLRPIGEAAQQYRADAEAAIRSGEPGTDADRAENLSRNMLNASGGPASGVAAAWAGRMHVKHNLSVTVLVSGAREIARDIAAAVTIEAAERAAASCGPPIHLEAAKTAARRNALGPTVAVLQDSAVGLIRAMVEIQEPRH